MGRDTLVGLVGHSLVGHSLVGHSCGTLLWNNLVVHSFLPDTLMEHPCGTLLWDTLVGYSGGTLQVCKASVSYETSSKVHASILQSECFVRDFLKNSRFESAKQAFRTRLPPKVTRPVSKTSVSYETSSKSHMSKSPKRAFRARLPPKVKREAPSKHARQAALPSSFAIPAPPNNARSHANLNVTA